MSNPTYPSSFTGLMELVAYLRGPDGCPWDREQTRASIRSDVREECHELLDAIDEDDASRLVEELGDVLFHAAFQIRLGDEGGEFNEQGRVPRGYRKAGPPSPARLRRRDVSDSDEVLSRWHAIKRQERSDEEAGALVGVPRSLPSLAHAQTLQERAARVGFDWDDLDGVLRKVDEEVGELRGAEDRAQREAEIGDLLFSLVNVCRWLETDAESALRASSTRFQRRFEAMERIAAERGLSFETLPLDDKEALWQEAKGRVR